MKFTAGLSIFIALIVGLPFLGGCQTGSSSSPTERVRIGKTVYTIEIAATDKVREHGLMERDDLANDAGMLFVFTDSQVRNFWMYHTRFDLDILYLDADGVVVSIKSMKAYDQHQTSSDYPAKYAIELRQGQADIAAVKVGDHVNIPAKAVARD